MSWKHRTWKTNGKKALPPERVGKKPVPPGHYIKKRLVDAALKAWECRNPDPAEVTDAWGHRRGGGA